MTIKEFVSKMPKTGWKLCRRNWELRRNSQCPIQAVGKTTQTAIAIKELKLTEKQASLIIDAADGYLYNVEVAQLRNAMLKHVNLLEKSNE